MTKQIRQGLKSHTHSSIAGDDKNNSGPTWCEEQQIYIDGTIASSSRAEEHINSILSAIQSEKEQRDNDSSDSSSANYLHIFGYGSLCWNPGSSDEVLANEKVRRKVAKAIGWKRCWCQKSTDHRGSVSFPGLVCTLLSDEEISSIKKKQKESSIEHCDRQQMEKMDEKKSMTEGVLYTIPSELVEQCLAELDFREKGGYARDVIDVVVMEERRTEGEWKKDDNETQSFYKALLYRGTPDNPAFSKRALLDPHYAAAIMAVAEGPSGSNDKYLFNLDDFLSTTTTASFNSDSSAAKIGDMQTKYLASLTQSLQTKHDIYFLFGAGSNQHDQLLLESTEKDYYGDFVNSADLANGEDAHLLNNIVLITPKGEKVSPINVRPKALFCGGGHSAMLSEQDDLYLWGWNENGQLGRSTLALSSKNDSLIRAPVIESLNIKVAVSALGHSHTLVIEKGTGKLFCFGDDGRGQVSGISSSGNSEESAVKTSTTPSFAENDRFIDVAAGVFHSAAITKQGELITFGCGRFGQSLSPGDGYPSNSTFGRWRPEDGSKLTKVVCGRRHTMVLDEYGRVWTMGENKYGQLGRPRAGKPQTSHIPELVGGVLGGKGSGCVHIDCGWSHNTAFVCTGPQLDGELDAKWSLFAWGRNDKHQCGANVDNNSSGIDVPQLVLQEINGRSLGAVCCGAESVMIIDSKGEIYGCGWNEHGNLAAGHDKDTNGFTKLRGAKIRNSKHPTSNEVVMAAGGAHFLAALR